MTRALVLGGGGPVGVGWESGLAAGLAAAGVDLSAADFIVGTSAGSVVGSRLALGLDPSAALGAVSQPLPLGPDGPDGAGGPEAIAELMAAWGRSAEQGLTPEQTRAELGRVALAAKVTDEAVFTGADAFAGLDGYAWPAAFRCTAVDAHTGEFRVWDHSTGVPLARAVASSCSVPGIFPPVTIGDRRYIDGGMRTALNADLAAGHDAVIAVSCMPLELPAGMTDPVFDSMNRQVQDELAVVRDSGAALEIIVPSQEFLDVSGWGANLMDPSRVPDAYQAGLNQAAVELDRLRAIWSA
jgi:NTE family protein